MDNVNRRFKTRAEREEEEKKKRTEGGVMLPTYEELTAIEEKAKEDAAAAVSSEKGLDFFQKPSNWDDGYQFGDVTKTALGTLGDVGVNVVKGAVRLGEGVGDAAQFGAAAVADLFGADEKAEKIRQNAQKEKVTAAFSGVDDYLEKYSVLGRTSDAAAESLGQIGALVATGGLAGAAGLGTVGATALTTGLMGASSFGSGTSEAYASGADEGEAEAYGIIAGAADALSEMIFSGLGKAVNVVGISKGLSSADDMLAKALSSKIKNTMAKNAVQLGVKAGAEGLEEVIAGTMQAAGKKATYMSEQDFLDIVKDENLLEQFIVGAMASGITQAPSFVKANRTGVDLVADESANGEGAGEPKRIWEDNNPDHMEIERTGRESGAADDDIRMAGELSDILGKQIRFYREDAKDGVIRNGEYHEDTDTIYINAASKNVKSQIVAHELTHSIEKAGAYKSLVDKVFEKLRADGEDIDALYRKKEMLYAKADAKLGSYEEITSEIVAEFVEKRLLTDEKSIKSLVHENRSLGQKIKDWFDSVLAKMDERRAAKGDTDAQARVANREFIVKMRDLYAEALGESTEGSGNRVRHSINPEFVGRLDAWDKKTEGFAFVIGSTSEALKKAGIPDKQIRMDASKIKTLLNKHSGMTIDIVKQIPELLENPVIVIDSKSNNDSKIVMGELYDDNDKLVTTVLLLAPSSRGGNVLDMIKISSAEGRGHIGSLLKKGDGTPVDVRYVDEKRIHDWLNVNKLQLPLRNLGQDSNGSISQGSGNVKGDGTISELGMEEISTESRIERGVGRKLLVSDLDGEPIEAERISSDERDIKYSVSYAGDIAKKETEYLEKQGKNAKISAADLKEAQRVTAAMVDVMMQYSDILPEDKIGKVLTKNGSYDVSVENTTICVRTLAYNEFVDRVQEQIGRPLTQMESFLVSQKLYDIAQDPQCLYCYVSLDRKSYNEMLLRYMQERDTAIERYNESDKMPATVDRLYQEFLGGRKPTDQMRQRYNKWIAAADNGTKLLSLADIATEERQKQILASDGNLADQLKEARKYAQSASWSKLQKNYVAYRDEILKLGDRVVKNLNEHYGMRWYSFSDYSPAFIVENMQQITDAAIRGLKGLSYTKETDYAEIFAPTGMNINISVFIKQDKDGGYYIDERQSANLEKAIALRDQYPNVGIVATVTDDGALRWAGEQDWTDVIIPFHIVRTGTDVAKYYKWLNYTAESGDTVKDGNLWEAYVDSLDPKTEAARKKVSKNIYPSEHHNDKETYLNLCQSRGLTPRFARFAGEGWYMKLVNETRQTADETKPLKPIFNEAAAKESFARFVDKGGYNEGWYREGVDVDAEVDVVAKDVLAGKQANEVGYGRQDIDAAGLMASRKSERSHGRKYSVSEDTEASGVVSEQEQKEALDFIRKKTQRLKAAYDRLVEETNGIDEIGDGHRDAIEKAYDAWQESKKIYDMMRDAVKIVNGERSGAEVEEGFDAPMPSDEDAPPMRGYAAEYGEPETIEVEAGPKLTRKVLHKNIMDGIKKKFEAAGFDLDKVLAKAKNLSTFATVDNTPSRVMEKSLGYKEGGVLADMTVNQAAKNETEGIRWLNQFTDRKDGVLAKLSKKYNIKPGSKESAAAQMYAEGFWVNDKNEIVEYGDRELAADFPDATVQKNIKGLARDPIVRQIYDETLDAINASRTRNAFPEIQKLDNYFLHFRAMDDTFSRLGIPFNPNDIRAKDLPTDLNGVTADLKPGQPYFASANHRLGKRTSFDLLGGMEKYLTSAKNQIYHIDDIQTLRALRNYVADMYGQAEGLSNLDELSDEEVEARIKDVYNSHLSTFAKFLNEEANILAGKTSLIDRGLEGVIGRRGITFLNDVNRQVGANMVGFNISSSLTNFLAPVQAFAKMNKAAFIKGFAQTVENRLKSIAGNGDDFAQRTDVIVRRKGSERFNRTLWQKMSDPGYLLMSMVDDISTEIIARAKYNELTAKGVNAETANRETDKWVSRLMGDRSLGQMPQIYNSKMLGLVTKFQLEVRNQLDSQFYDTIKEAQVEYEDIGDKTKRNAKVAAKVAATFAELAIAQHLFGAVFESIAGYNPAFDIIDVITKALGFDDEEESEDTVLDNIEQGVLALIEDLPYSSVIMDGGRIPISSALPIGELIKGEDEYGNEINRLKTAAEALPYYVLPGGYGQAKKTAKGVSMFTGDKEVTGSYTDSGNLRFPVKATPGNIAQAAVFGQWASENARDYFNNERTPANERQTRGYSESGLEWDEYTKYRNQISKLDKDADKLALIDSLKIDTKAKEALYRWLVASAKKDDDGNIIGSSEDDRLAVLYDAGLDFDDYAASKLKQAELNADENLSANQRATRFYAWAANAGYTDEQTDVITDQFKFSSGFKVEPTTYNKLVDGGVTADNAVLVTDALSGTSRAIDKINAVWSTGLTGTQLDNAVKAVVTEGWYERYRKVIDANVPLDVLTWVLDNADQNGNDSIDNEERTLILSQLALSRKELAALWEATGGSEKSNPYKSGSGTGVSIEMPEVKMPEIKMPEINVPYFGF